MNEFTQHKRAPSNSELAPREKRILALTCICHFLTHMFVLVFPAVTIPIMNTLGMPLEKVIELSFLMYLLYGVGALPAGYIVDRWQAKRMLLIGVFAMGTGLILAGALATARAISVCLMLVGLGASVYHPAGLALISRTVERRGYALGINGVWGNLGIASAPVVTGILTWLFGWQAAFIALGLTAVAAGLGLATLGIDETITDNGPRRNADSGDYLKYFVVLCAALVFAGLVYRGNMVLLPAYIELKTTFFHNLVGSLSFIEMQGSKTLAATILTSVVLVVGIFGQMIGGRVADRFDLRYSYLGVHAASVPFLISMAFASNYLLVLCAALFVFFNLGMQPIENSLIAALTPTRWRSTGFAVKFVLNFGVGSTVVYLIGFVKTRYALETVYLFLAAVAFLLVSSIIGLIVASRRVPEIRN